MSTEKTEYIPYGDEWKKEVSKLSKELIIEMFSKKGIECDKHIDQRAEAIGRVIEGKEKIEKLTEEINKLTKALDNTWVEFPEHKPTFNEEYIVAIDLDDEHETFVNAAAEYNLKKGKWYYPNTDEEVKTVMYWREKPMVPTYKSSKI